MLRSNNMARAVGRAFGSTYARLEAQAIAAARRNDAMLLYVPDNPSNVLQFSAGYTPSTVGTPVGRLLDMQYGAPRLGPELLPNTRFTDDYAGWTTVLGAVSVTGGRLRTARGPSTGGRAVAAITCIPGRTYRVTADRYLGGVSSAGLVVAVTSTSTVNNILSNYGVAGAYSAVFVATQVNHWIALDTGTGSEGQYCEYDNVSVREVIEAPASRGDEKISNGDFSTWSNDNPVNWGLSFVETASEYVTQGSPGVRLVSTAGAFNEIAQNVGLVNGRTYEVTIQVSSCNGSGAVSNASSAPVSFTAPGWYRAVFTAMGGSIGLKRNIGGVPCDFTVTYLSCREVFGYHGLQATAANKPTLVRIPRKRGAELILNGNFNTDLNGWTQGNTGASTVTWSSGQALFNTNGTDGARLRQQVSVTPGKTYWISCYATPSLSTGLGTAAGSTDLVGYMSGSVGFAYTATSSLLWLNTVTATNGVMLDNVSVREVLEWSNAVQIDGVDDWMDVTYRDYFAGGAYTFVGAWAGSVTGNSAFVLAQSSTSDVDPLCSPLFVPSGSNHVSIFERGDTAQVGISGSSYSLDTLQESACVELLQTSSAGTGNYKGWRGGALVRNINYTRVAEALTTNRVTLGASQRTSVSGFSKGSFALLCWSANVMPDADRRAIARFASYLIGEPYV